ncbi:MAG: 4-hydroxy-tetrahydrodipicolinate synthase [Hyphomicrobiales bacterium]|nr:4-hydroxy-tetrahydrodipicolinate synthase [Hyphomicrobiales bacterium]
MIDPRLTGIHCAIITPLMDDRDRVDSDGMKQLIDSLLLAGITGIVVLGGTGEYTALSFVERERAVTAAVEHTNGRVPVTVGIVAPGLGDAKAMANAAEKAGADYIMPVTPYYVHPTQEGIVRWYSALAESTALPLILYNIPSRTGVNLYPATVLKLADQIGRVAGIKECTSDLGQFSELVQTAGDRISILSGEEYYVLPELLLGARGGVLASSNIVPGHWVRLFEATQHGDYASAREIYVEIFPLLRAVFSEVNPGPLKAAMRHVGLPAGPVADPLVDPSPIVEERLFAALSRLGVVETV